MKHFDLIVVGGGLTGTAAAVAAARGGLSVMLVEQSGSLGGAACTCLINPFMPYATKLPTPEHPEGEDVALSQGLFAEITARMEAKGDDIIRGSATHRNTFSEEWLKIVLDEMTDEAGVDVLFHAPLCGAEKEGETLKAIKVVTKKGILTLTADAFIDCTGDADLAVMSGCPYHLGRAADNLCQPMTLCFRLGNIDTEAFFAHKKEINEVYARWQAEGRTDNLRENVLTFRTVNKGVVHFNTTRIVKLDPTDPFDVSRAEKMARKQMIDILMMLRESFDFCKDAELLMSANQIGVRESRMIDGEHLLTETELRDCVRFPDAIAAGNYDIDIHNPEGSGTSHYYFPDGEYYTIPFRSLIPKNADNLLVAGRCISSTHEAQASYRVMPIVTCLGEAAGTAAAVALKAGTPLHRPDMAEVQRVLKENGAFIG